MSSTSFPSIRNCAFAKPHLRTSRFQNCCKSILDCVQKTRGWCLKKIREQPGGSLVWPLSAGHNKMGISTASTLSSLLYRYCMKREGVMEKNKIMKGNNLSECSDQLRLFLHHEPDIFQMANPGSFTPHPKLSISGFIFALERNYTREEHIKK